MANIDDAQLKIVVEAVDNASATLKKLSQNVADSSKSVQETNARAGVSFGTLVGSIFTAQAAYNGIVGTLQGVKNFMMESVAAAEESQKIQTQLGAVLKSTGYAAGVTAQEMIKLSKSLQNQTTYSDEAILSAENLLLTFTNISGGAMPAATKIVLDMSTALGQDLKSSAIQVGKALQDPILGVTALRRVGVNFNEDQTKVIKNLVETGHAAEAQALIMKELNKEFGGSAAEQLNTYAGRVEHMKNQFNDMQELVGNAVMPTMDVFTTFMISRFNMVGESANDVSIAIGERLAQRVLQLGAVLKAVFGMEKDLGKMAYGSFSTVTNPFSSSGRNTLKEGFKSFFGIGDKSASADIIGQLQKDFKSIDDKITAETAKMIDPNKYDKAFKGQKFNPNFGTGGTDAAKKATDALKKLGNAYDELKKTAGQDLASMGDDFKEKMATINKSIDDQKKRITELTKAYTKGVVDDTASVADKIIASEKKVADLKEQIAKATSYSQYQELQKQLAEEQKNAASAADFKAGHATEITEAQRRAGLTDIQRTIEDYTKKQDLDKQAYLEQKTQLEKDLADKQKEAQDEITLTQTKLTAIGQIINAAYAYHRTLSAMTKAAITKDIDDIVARYSSLTSNIGKIKGASISEIPQITLPKGLPKFEQGGIVPGRSGQAVPIIAHAGEEVIPANRRGQSGTVHNYYLTFSNVVAGDDGVRKIITATIQQLNRNATLKSFAGA